MRFASSYGILFLLLFSIFASFDLSHGQADIANGGKPAELEKPVATDKPDVTTEKPAAATDKPAAATDKPAATTDKPAVQAAPEGPPPPPPPPAELDGCNGVFLTYTLLSREKEYPRMKDVAKQPWAFKAEASLINVGDEEVKGWKMYIGFQHKEILVSADGAVPIDAEDFPAFVGNGTTLAGSSMPDLKTAIETANDFTQMAVRVQMSGTQFGLGAGSKPMPKTIKLLNDGFKCPAPARQGSRMFMCCKKDVNAKTKKLKSTKFPPRRYGDLTISYDILQAYQSNYYAQVTIDNNHPLGRLDHWNLTWEWQGGEFIYSIKGAYARIKDPAECLYGLPGRYYKDMDFSQVANCQKKPIISDLPSEKKDDEKVGKLPYCCRNGTVLPPLMDKSKARSMFQLEVFKLPPYDNRTALTPPMKFNIDGVINPQYTCGPPVRVDSAEFPDPSGLSAVTKAVASWQVVCNFTKPKPQKSSCCVSFSAFYNDSAIPCNTCACGRCDANKCNPNAPQMLLPIDALLVPFVNRTVKAKAWAKSKHWNVPNKLPCGDNCPVSINWHVSTDHNSGWSARITIFNWEDFAFEDWFAAIQFGTATDNLDNVYSFNVTKIPGLKTYFLQGLKDFNYLVGETKGNTINEPRVPGKQQSVITFNKKNMKNFDITRDGFPTKIFFNGEECALPPYRPKKSSAHKSYSISVIAVTFIAFITFLVMTDHLY